MAALSWNQFLHGSGTRKKAFGVSRPSSHKSSEGPAAPAAPDGGASEKSDTSRMNKTSAASDLAPQPLDRATALHARYYADPAMVAMTPIKAPTDTSM